MVGDFPGFAGEGDNLGAERGEFVHEAVAPCFEGCVVVGQEHHVLAHETHHGFRQWAGFVHLWRWILRRWLFFLEMKNFSHTKVALLALHKLKTKTVSQFS